MPRGCEIKLVILPLLLAGMGVIASIIGVFSSVPNPIATPQKALNVGSFGAAFLAAAATYPITVAVLGGGTFMWVPCSSYRFHHRTGSRSRDR